MKKQIFAGIDWYTGSNSYSALELNAPYNWQSAHETAQAIMNQNSYLRHVEVNPDLQREPFYEYTFTDGNHLRLSLSSRQSQGVKIVITGQDWSAGESHEAEQWQALQRQNWRTTRVDVAYDFLNFGYVCDKIWEQNLKERAYEGHRKNNLIVSPLGSTIAVGSRKSEKYLRLYEKGMEQGTTLDWFRAEIELKGRTARAYTGDREELLRMSAKAIATMSPDLPEEMTEFFTEFSQGVTLPEIGRKQTRGNKEKWLLTQIVPILKKERAKNSPAWRAFIEMMSKP